MRYAGRRAWTATALVCLAFGAAACGDDDDDDDNGAASDAAQPAATAPAAGAQPATLDLTASASGERKSIEAPATVPAGLVQIRLRNTDEVPREAQIVRVTGDQSIEDVLKITQAQDAPIPQFIQDGGGVAPIAPGETGTVTQVLQPGTHYIFDTGEEEGEDVPSNAELGATARFVVEESDGGVAAELPAVPGRITAIDYGFEFAGLKPGANQVRFENTGDELHHALLFPIIGDASLADVRSAFSEDAPEGPPPVDFERNVGTTVIDGGVAQNVELDLEAGRYAVVCFIADRAGGPPHVAKGMVSELEVK